MENDPLNMGSNSCDPMGSMGFFEWVYTVYLKAKKILKTYYASRWVGERQKRVNMQKYD